MCVHTWVHTLPLSTESSGGGGTAFIHNGLSPGPQNIGRQMIEKNPFSDFRDLGNPNQKMMGDATI